MISLKWRKVLRDLWHNKTRTILVMLSIAIGVFAVGMIAHTALLVTGQVQEDTRRSNPANIIIYAERLDEEMIRTIGEIPGVADAEGRSSITVRVRLSDDEWTALTVNTFPAMDEIRIDRVLPVHTFEAAPELLAERGIWPPGDREIVVERSSFLMPNMMPAAIAVGDTLHLETLDGRARVVDLAGLAHEPNTAPATFIGQGIAYVDNETFGWLGGDADTFGQVKIVVDGDPRDRDALVATATEIERKIERSGRTVYYKELLEPGKSPRDSILQGITAMMFPLGVLSLLLSSFLVVNTVNALMSQHVRQIGIMKAIGARNGQITGMYLALVLVFGLLALLVAVPLAALATSQTAVLLAGFLNTSFPRYSLPWQVLGIEIVIGLVVPLLAALRPILKGTRIPVHAALSDYGVGGGRFGRSLFDRSLSHIKLMSRPMMVSLRNTFRRRGRLLLTLFTLVLGGAIFIAVTNVYTSLLQTLDDALAYWQYDVGVSFGRSYRLEEIEQIAADMPGVVETESWDFAALRRVRADGTESDAIIVGALPPETKMLSPTLIAGRWLLPGDENAIVISQEVRKNEPDLVVGDALTLKIDGKESAFTVVGVVRVVGSGNLAYVPYEYFTHAVGNIDRASRVQVVTARHDAETLDAVAKALEDTYKAAGMQVTRTETITWIREQNEFYFRIIVVLLLVMAVLIAAVGALGLTGTMSINVLERTREIGVMRAIGASNRAVRNIVLVEGVLIGLLSWLIGALLAMPLGRVMSDGVGFAFFQMPLSYAFSYNGVLLWLALVLILSAAASLLPARNAAKLTVRETLAYE